jgi:20S proteasome alpha/beta subunit
VTVVLALKCVDGIVIAADSQITDSARGLSYPAQKLHPLGATAAWGGSGARSALVDVKELFDANPAAILEGQNLGHALQEAVLPVLRHHYAHFIEKVPGETGPGGTPATYVLVAGYREDGTPFIADIDPHGLVGRYEETGFHAIGSGSAMAQQAGALLAHFRMTERDVDHGVVAAVRVLDALRVTSPSVGGPVDVYRMTPEGARGLDPGEIEQVRERVRRWEELEDKLLDELFGEHPGTP